MSRFTSHATPLSGLMHIEHQRLADERGFLSRLFCSQELAALGWTQPVVQINHTYTARRGTVRGLHYQQAPALEAKLVSCLRGAVWDVVVDLRVGSPTYLQWHAEELSAGNRAALLIPPGCAHGFQALEDDTELLYLHTAPHTPECEGALHVLDARLDIVWPLPVVGLSPRDAAHPMLNANFAGIRL